MDDFVAEMEHDESGLACLGLGLEDSDGHTRAWLQLNFGTTASVSPKEVE